MEAAMISRLVGGLGFSYNELVGQGLIQNLPLKRLFDASDNEELIQNPVPGVKLWFWEETKRLDQVMIILIQTVGQPVYSGQLPQPFKLDMDQQYVREVLGVPTETKPPVKLPGGMGGRGGADIYYLDQRAQSNVMVTLSYLENLRVNNISFSLINSGHD
ncbi:pyocin immunity protein [Pseudomonas libanensis]|uniref:Pyocin immunity protein n=2 Tax=Pseudomonas libanensis TaxID=75588 RepID=A0A0R2YIT4_9PSED|nr:pyocin immunity protein [Pseudomonas libanensis]